MKTTRFSVTAAGATVLVLATSVFLGLGDSLTDGSRSSGDESHASDPRPAVTSEDVDRFLRFAGRGEAPATRPDPGAPREQGSLAAIGNAQWPPPDAKSQSPYMRAALARRADPPFGPARMPILGDAGYTIEQWERAYYESRPDEYARFVEMFGDVHALQ